MINIKAKKGKLVAYALVRDGSGNPRVDSPSTLPPEVFQSLTDSDVERVYGGLSQDNLPDHLKNVQRI